MAAEIINLSRARKAKARAEKARRQTRTASCTGRPSTLKQLGKARKDKAGRDLDAHKKD